MPTLADADISTIAELSFDRICEVFRDEFDQPCCGRKADWYTWCLHCIMPMRPDGSHDAYLYSCTKHKEEAEQCWIQNLKRNNFVCRICRQPVRGNVSEVYKAIRV